MAESERTAREADNRQVRRKIILGQGSLFAGVVVLFVGGKTVPHSYAWIVVAIMTCLFCVGFYHLAGYLRISFRIRARERGR